MLCLSSSTGFFHHPVIFIPSTAVMANASSATASSTFCSSYKNEQDLRYDYDRIGCWDVNDKINRNKLIASGTVYKKRMLSISPVAASSAAGKMRKSSLPDFYKEALKAARKKFTQEISFQSKDKDISLAKALLFIASEDEAFVAFNREMDACSIQSEIKDGSMTYYGQEWDCIENMPLDGKNMNEWLVELDVIAKEVEAELVYRDIGCHLVEVLEAINLVLFESRGFKRSPVLVDSKCSYLHSVLRSGYGSGILLSIIYIEVCRRLNLTIVGSRVGEEFLIWPRTGNPEELFKEASGHSLFGVVNGSCVEDPRSKASDLNSHSLLGLDIATNRDIIGIALANLIRLHWKHASRMNHGLMLTSPLRPVHDPNGKLSNIDGSNVPLVRPKDLRFKMLILQDWHEKGENCE